MYKKTYKKCKFCSKEIVSSRHNDHESKCLRMQADKSITKRKVGRPIGSIAWNKGLTKETDQRVMKNANSVSSTFQKQIYDGTYVPRKMGETARQELSERQSLTNTGGKSKWFDIAGKRVQGTYEKQFAESLEQECISWEKIKTNNHIFKYNLDGKIKSYAPDFYLLDFDLYVEIKGYWWGNDEEKMRCIREQHKDKKVIIILGKQKLDYICSNVIQNLLLEPVWSW